MIAFTAWLSLPFRNWAGFDEAAHDLPAAYHHLQTRLLRLDAHTLTANRRTRKQSPARFRRDPCLLFFIESPLDWLNFNCSVNGFVSGV